MDSSGGGGNVFENDYVRVGLPVLLGVAAASGPAGARGAGALVSAMGAMNGMSSSRTQKQLRELQIKKEQAPQLVEHQGQSLMRDPMTGNLSSVDISGLGSGPVGVLQRRLNETLMAPTPLPEGQQGPPAPATPIDMLSRISALQQSPEGRNLLATNPVLGKMMGGESEAMRGVDTALTRQRVLMPGEVQETVQKKAGTYPYELEIARQTQAGATEQSIRKQEALRQEETKARESTSLLEAANAGLMQDKSTNIRRYYWTQGPNAGQNASPAKMTLPEARQLEAEGKIANIPDDSMHKEWITLQQIAPLVAKIRNGVEKVYAKEGAFAEITPGSRLSTDSVKTWWLQTSQKDPDLVNVIKDIQGNVTLIGKKLAGGAGTQTEQDIVRDLNLLPSMDKIPDTRAVAYGRMNSLMDLLNSQSGVLLLTPSFKHPSLQPLPVEQQQAQPQAQPQASPPPASQTAPAGGPGFDANSILQKYRK